tara:strand:+ start:526 stop:921 length:396 start_codon:yes stop_codon:yes gene_type:complete
MTYARVENGSVTKYPYDMYALRADNPNTSFPKDSFDRADVRSTFNIVEVAEVSKPSEAAHHVSEGAPVQIGGVWTQVWNETPRSAAELELKVIGKRSDEYGRPEDQIEFITENGLEAWQAKVAEIKARHPK